MGGTLPRVEETDYSLMFLVGGKQPKTSFLIKGGCVSGMSGMDAAAGSHKKMSKGKDGLESDLGARKYMNHSEVTDYLGILI